VFLVDLEMHGFLFLLEGWDFTFGFALVRWRGVLNILNVFGKGALHLLERQGCIREGCSSLNDTPIDDK